MKVIRFFAIVSLITALSACSSGNNASKDGIDPNIVNLPTGADGKVDKSKLPIMTFEATTHDFGTIKQGEKVNYSFKFKNTGKGVMYITSASASCGCTVPKFPAKPILPGDEEFIEVTFDSANKGGQVDKVVTVVANTVPAENNVHILANIIGN